MPAARDEEVLDVVDEHDHVVDQATRARVHAEGLLHRAVQVHAYDRGGRLLLQKRGEDVETYPGRWTGSAAGHVDAGETYREAAKRELLEEVGLEGKLRKELKLRHEDTPGDLTDRELIFLFTVLVDEDPDLDVDPGEVQAVRWMLPEDVEAWVRDEPEAFAPSFRDAFERYLWSC